MHGVLNPRIVIVAYVAIGFMLSSFIATRIIMASPAASIPKLSASGAVSEGMYANHSGIIAWLGPGALTIVDRYGVTRRYTLTEDTLILNTVDAQTSASALLTQEYITVQSSNGVATSITRSR